jgi:Cu(I)/Ag(I) efflux system periplasmic protein CusF
MKLTHILFVSALAALSGMAQAQSSGHAHGYAADAKAAAPAAGVLASGVDGEVRRIDRDNARLSIRHGEIKAIDMPPMTMVFHVRDTKQLDGIKVGDKIRFSISRDEGKLFASEMQVQR